MALHGVIFDLDNTLANTSALESIRENQDYAGLNADTLEKISLFPSAKQILEFLKNKAIPMAIVTNSPRWYAEKVLDHLGVNQYIKTVITHTEVGSSGKKPAPTGIIHALNALGLNAYNHNVLYIGDDGKDIIASYHANVFPVIASWSRRSLISSTPFSVLSSSHLIKYYNSINDLFLIAERCAKLRTFNFNKDFLNFLPLDGSGNIVSIPSELEILCFGRYFSQKNITTAQLHDKHALSLDIIEKENGDLSYEVPSYWVDIFLHSIKKIPQYKNSNMNSIDIVTIIPSKKNKVARLEKMLKKIEDINENKDIKFINDIFWFNDDARSVKELGKLERYSELKEKMHFNEKYSDLINGKNILILDDVITSGSTLKVAREKISPFSPNRVLGACIAKTVSLQKDFKECPKCHSELFINKNKSTGARFYGCRSKDQNGNYCTYTESIKEKDCPNCGRPMFRRKNSSNGVIFLACSGFKEEHACNTTEPL
jgi:phosphoglycolate phosphatase-like HAD superfamily hydrolase/ssDNA-binding Zn-finger/Zn-ribbon topoisomerase 1/pyrimidine operon attenuation protein/uracil phosphoribosyltransferase